jgi:hypothetical protein
LLEVINSWGTCPAVGFCRGDAVGPSNGPPDGLVNANDLLAVINNWTANCAGGSGALTSVQDCMDMATYELELEPHSPEWTEVVNKCVAGLCEAQIISCY